MFLYRPISIPLAIAALLASAQNGFTATFTQTSNNVANLIAAITASNTNGQSDTIDLGGFTFTLTAADNGDNGLPIIAETLTIRNGVIERSTEAGTPEFRLLELGTGANLSLDGVTLRNGLLSAAGADGGAIFVGDATISLINNSTFTNNVVNDSGGAIFLDANAVVTTITNSSFTNNGAGQGGGIYVSADASLNLLSGSTFSSNNAQVGDGGGLLVNGVGSSAVLGTLSNSTFSDNTAAGNGGGTAFAAATITNISNLTVANNDAGIDGGGIFLDGTSTVTALSSSIIALNTDAAAPSEEPDLSNAGTITNSQSNLIGTDGGHAIADNVDGNQVGTNVTPLDPVIGSLASNGGPTETRALLAGSPAIDAGANSLSLANDQRGPGFPRARGAAVDIGAFELQDCAAIGDTDGDGACNDADNCSATSNPDQANSDFDAFGNACDNCPLVPNNTQADVDLDTVGDACDSCIDTDQDGVGNPGTDTSDCPAEDEIDNCPLIANPDQEDTDDDELGDKCDTIPGGATVIPAPPPPPFLPPPPGAGPPLAGPDPGLGAPADLGGFEEAPSPDVMVSRNHGGYGAIDPGLGDNMASYDIEEGTGCSTINSASNFLPLLALVLLSMLSRRRRRHE